MKPEKEIRELRDSLRFVISPGPITLHDEAWARAVLEAEVLSWILGENEAHQMKVDALNEGAAFARQMID